MSTTTIIIAVSASLAVLVIVVFALQQFERSNQAKQATIAALKTRLRNFQYLLEGFPDGFLSRDLRVLVCRCLLDALEQLVKLEPRHAQHRQELAAVSERMQQLRNQPQQGAYQPLGNGEQIQEVQRLLTNLLGVVEKLTESKRLTPVEGSHYRNEISALTLRITLDGYLQAAQQAMPAGKPRVAAHYYRLAADKMRKHNGNGVFSDQLQLCEQRIAELEQLAEHHEPVSAAPPEGWQGLTEEEEAWKKKSVYD